MKPFEPLRAGASREEVLAWLAEQDRRDAEREPIEWPEVPEGFEGCVWSLDGSAVACYGPVQVDPVLAAQRLAGEEDQSVPGWDSGA